MRKIGILLLLLMMLLGSGCSNANNTKEVVYATIDSYEMRIVMHTKAGAFLQALGNPAPSAESKSCAFEGVDRFYIYEGYELSTYEKNNEFYWLSLHAWDDTITINDAINVGASLEEALKVLPEPSYSAQQLVRFELKDTLLTLTYTADNIIETITMSAKLD